MEIKEVKEFLLGNGFCLNNTKYRDNGEAIETFKKAQVQVGITQKPITVQVEVGRDENNMPILEDRTAFEDVPVFEEQDVQDTVEIIKTPDYIEEFIRPYYEVTFLTGKEDSNGIPLTATIKIDDLQKVQHLKILYFERRYIAFLIDSKDGFKIQIKVDQINITPTKEVIGFEELTAELIRNRYNKYTEQTLLF